MQLLCYRYFECNPIVREEALLVISGEMEAIFAARKARVARKRVPTNGSIFFGESGRFC